MKIFLNKWVWTLAVIAGLAPMKAVMAQSDTESLRQSLLVEPLVIEISRQAGRAASAASPGSSAGTPSGFGAGYGSAFFGLSVSDSRRAVGTDGSTSTDASMSLGFGLGNIRKTVATEISLSNYSVSPSDFADSGTLGVKFARLLGGFGVAFGLPDLVKWGEADEANDEITMYVAGTKGFKLGRTPVITSLGFGNGTFRTLDDIENDKDNINLFGSLGVRVASDLSVNTSWTGRSLNIGASFVPFDDEKLVTNLIATNVTEEDDGDLGFALSFGYAFKYAD